jgi:hypothetical protein
VNPILEYILERVIKSKLLKERRGLLVGAIIATAICVVAFFWFFWSDVSKYRDFGQKIQSYDIKKGQSKLVAVNELIIVFDNTVFSSDPSKKLVYPFIRIQYYRKPQNRFQSHSFTPMELNNRHFFDSKYYYYMVRMVKLHEGKDTIATFDVYRKEYPVGKAP